MFISELHIQGYKRLRDVKLPLGPLTVLIGPNASGKTSLLECLGLLRDCAAGTLQEAVSAYGGIARMVSRRARAGAVCICADVEGARYEVQLRPVGRGSGYEILREALSPPSGGLEAEGLSAILQGAPDGRGYWHSESGEYVDLLEQERGSARDPFGEQEDGGPEAAPFNELETVLSRAGSIQAMPPLARNLASRLSRLRSYAPLDVGPDAPIRRPQAIEPVGPPGPDGSDLVSTVHHKQSSDRPMFDLLESVLRTAYPGFEWVGTRAVARGLAMLVWRERGAEFDAGELSEGTLRFVWLASLLLTSRMPPLILIDEPEVSLHPDLQHALADLLMHASGRTQLVVATQSPELVSWLEPKHLVVLESDDEGWTLARSGEALNVDDWLEDYALGQLWTKGVLGGRP